MMSTATAFTTYGTCGVKVWIFKGEIMEHDSMAQDKRLAEAEALRRREEDLARREGRLQEAESQLQDRTTDVQRRDAELSERDRNLAGREALAAKEPETYRRAPVADYGMFYDSLSSYGSWFETPDYGYVWQPVIVREVSWRPYTRGRWVCSDYGWTWLSDEPFGWATYHYGRWALLRGAWATLSMRNCGAARPTWHGR